MLIFSLVAAFLAPALALEVDPKSLQCNGLTTPIGLSTQNPRLSWINLSSARNQKQSAYQLQASSEVSFSRANLWDTGKIASLDISVIYNGKTLASRERAYWRVRTWDAHNNAGPWSEITWFELALMDQRDWKARWITNEQYVTGKNGLPMFAKAFKTSCKPDWARLYYIGLGVQKATLNGEPVTDELLLPSYSTMNTSLFYNSYDVTSTLSNGENVLVVELGKGVYTAEPGLNGRYTKFVAANAPLPLKMLAQLEYTCPNGQKEMVVSDTTWRTTTAGPMLESSWYGGEEYDARRARSAVYLPGGDRSNWTKPNVTTSPYPSLHPQLLSPEMPSLKIVETFRCVKATKTSVSWVFDFGQNFAGWYRFNFRGTKGQRITMWPSEKIFTNGSADQSTTGAPIFDAYTFASNNPESHSPQFMYHGFRYLEVFGLKEAPSAEDIVGLRIRFDAEPTGNFETNVNLYNDIHRIIDQAIQNNMYSVLTDCPQREKMGWLDQDQLAIDPVFFGYNFRGYGRHMMKQMLDSQASDGEVPTTSPQLTEFGSFPPFGDGFDQAPNWGVSIVLFALNHYQSYGDIEVLSEYYPAMQKYINYLTAMNATTHILWSGLGDWESVDNTTPFGITSTSAYARGVAAMAKIASVLGRMSDAHGYTTLHQEILTAFQKEFFNTTHGTTYGSGSQASDAIALDIGAVPSKYVDAVYDHLATTMKKNGTHLSVGEVGLPALFRSLVAGNQHELLNTMMSKTTYPGYGFIVANGATSLTEYWNGPIGTGSQDHIIFDFGDTWLYGLAGMKQSEDSIAWQNIEFEPVIVENVNYARTEYNSVKGLVTASWEREGDRLTYNVTVPVGSSGIVYIPGSTHMTSVDNTPLLEHRDVLAVDSMDGKTGVRVGSGTYCFIARL